MKTSYLLFAHDNIKSCLHYLPHLCVCVHMCAASITCLTCVCVGGGGGGGGGGE